MAKYYLGGSSIRDAEISLSPTYEVKQMNHYLDTVFAGLNEGFLVVWHKSTKATRCFPVSKLEDACQYMLSASETDDVYFGWGLQEYEPFSGRGKTETVCALGGLMMDIDLKAEAGVHSNNDHLPETWEEVLAFIGEFGVPAPSAIRHSGNGTYFDWLFDRPAMIKSNMDRTAIQDLSRRLQKLIINLAQKHKRWKFDATHDLARVTRLPGTRNHKTSPAKPVSLLSLNSNRYSLEQLSTLMADLEKKHGLAEQGPKRSSKKPANDNEPDTDSEHASFDSIIAGCAWAEWTVERSEQLPEPHWYGLASVVGRCADGRARFHELSKNDPRYDATETDKKLNHALESAGPRTCSNIATELGFGGCRQCPLYGNLASPMSLARTNREIAKLMRNHAFDIATNRYIELETRRPLNEKAFSNKFRHLSGESTPHSRLISHRFTRKVDRADYLPGVAELFTANENGESVVNLWRPGPVQPMAGDCNILISHLAFIYPVERELNHLLDCLAHAVQKPGEKIKHALLTIGAQGTGKSFIGTLVGQIMGTDNMWIAESHDLNDGWTASMANRQVLSLEELGIFEKRETYESLKRWISDEVVTVNEKHVPKYPARTPRLILAFSNHQAPTALQEGDRRWWISRSPAEPKEPNYYETLFGEGLKQVPAFFQFLLDRDVSHFKPSAPPPLTAAKLDIIRWSRPAVEQEMEVMMEQGTHPFNRELVVAETVREEIATRQKGRWPSLRG
jgi:hypothetical protein